MFELQYDAQRARLTLISRTLLTADQVLDMQYLLEQRAYRLRDAGTSFHIALDAMEAPVQSQEVVQSLGLFMARCMELTSGRMAIMVGSMLKELQYRRIMTHPRALIVRSADAAEAWFAGMRPDGAAAIPE